MGKFAFEIHELGYYDFDFDEINKYFKDYEYYPFGIKTCKCPSHFVMIRWNNKFVEIIKKANFLKEGKTYQFVTISFYIEKEMKTIDKALDSFDIYKCDYRMPISSCCEEYRDFQKIPNATTSLSTQGNKRNLEDFLILKKWIEIFEYKLSKKVQTLQDLANQKILENGIVNPYSHIDKTNNVDISPYFIKKVIFIKKITRQHFVKQQNWVIFKTIESEKQFRWADIIFIRDNYKTIINDPGFVYNVYLINPSFNNTTKINLFLHDSLAYNENVSFVNGDIFICNFHEMVYDFLQENCS